MGTVPYSNVRASNLVPARFFPADQVQLMTAGGSPNLANRWEHFAHGADIGIRGYGNTIEEAFEQAALALTAVVCDPSEVHASEWVTIACDAPEGDLLLTDWLNALIYEMATRKMLFTRFDVHIIGTRLEGKACGEAVVRERHRPTVEPKGATYTELRVGQDEDEAWVAQCVIDV